MTSVEGSSVAGSSVIDSGVSSISEGHDRKSAGRHGADDKV
jgi:hypothetical protein